MTRDRKDPILRVTGVTKKYRLGQYGADSLQEEIKLWRERRRNPEQRSADDHERIAQNYIYALNGVDLTVYPGERVGIIGRNGSGKSTLLKLISRITAPTAGTIELWGKVTSMLEVGTGFHGEMTGRENIYLNGSILGMTRQEIENKMPDIVAFSEVRDFLDTPVKRYSSGMFIKLGFAVAAHLDSEIIIMDEVLAVGDMAFQHKCLDKMRQAALDENRTILYVSHNMSTIQRLCDRCIVMDEGRIVYDGDVDRAISLYLGVEKAVQDRYVFNDSSRPFDTYIRRNKRMTMEWLDMNCGGTVRAGDVMEAQISCVSDQAFSDVGFRLEFWAGDGTKIGTMLSGNFADLAEGRNLLRIRIDTSQLTAGQYRADLVAYLHDDAGNEDILDAVYPGFTCTVTTELDQHNYLDWHHTYWGHVRLHDLNVSRVENGEQ